MTIQDMVHNKMVLQRHRLENYGPDDMTIDLDFSKRMKIRDLDHLNPHYEFNEENLDEHYDLRPGPKGYSWTCVHKLPKLPPTSDRSAVGNALSRNLEGTNAAVVSHSNPYGVAVITSVAINGIVQSWEGNGPQRWTHCLEGTETKADEHQCQVMEVTTAYEMVIIRTENNNWKDLVITAADMDLDLFLQNESRSCFLPLSVTMTKDKAAVVDGAEEHPPSFSLNRSDLILDTDTERIKMPTSPPGGNFPQRLPANSTAKQHIEYAVRRHLEHILSVCAIPVTMPSSVSDTSSAPGDWNTKDDIQPVALTCGDMSGHRICTSAS